jgi:hypothetical protein
MHWFCGVDGADGSEFGHGAHYCCVDCGDKKNGVGSTKHNCKGGMGTVDKRKTSSRKQQPQVNETSDVSSVDSPPKKRATKQGISSSGTVNGRGAGNKYQKKDPKTTKARSSSTDGRSAGNKSQKKDPKSTKARSSNLTESMSHSFFMHFVFLL